MEDIILYKTSKHSLNTNNGILNESNLEFAKRTLLFDAIRNEIGLVKVKQHYPHNDISEVDLTLDVVIMTRKNYNQMLKLIPELPEENKVKKYLNFPKLDV